MEDETTKDYSINNATLAQNTVDSGNLNQINYMDPSKEGGGLLNHNSATSVQAKEHLNESNTITIHDRYVSNQDRISPKSQTTAAAVAKTGTTSSAWTSNKGIKQENKFINNGNNHKLRTKTAKNRSSNPRMSNPYSQ